LGRLSRPAAFIDRDGTINVRPPEHEYVTAVEEFAWLPGAADGLAQLAAAGFVLTVVSNQRGVARGLVSLGVLGEIERLIQCELAPRGFQISAFRYCIHDHGDGCDCRKPAPGMLLDLARGLDLDLERSWMIGDSEDDIRAGRAAGCHTAAVTPGVAADVRSGSLAQAADAIVGQLSASASKASTSA
jgi:D-glycero-D-manno-heptose 1,7-bisphosphate phosphatase